MVFERNIELEHKYELSKSLYHNFNLFLKIKGYNCNKIGEFQREYVYYDSSDHLLFNTGRTLSLRKRDKDAVLTYKIPCDGVNCRIEMQLKGIPLDDVNDYFDESFIQSNQIAKFLIPFYELIEIDKLRPTLGLSVINHRYNISSLENPHLNLFELSLAEVKGLKKPDLMFHELEVELEDGTNAQLYDFCDLISSIFNLKEIFLNKYQRAIIATTEKND